MDLENAMLVLIPDTSIASTKFYSKGSCVNLNIIVEWVQCCYNLRPTILYNVSLKFVQFCNQFKYSEFVFNMNKSWPSV